MSFIDKLWEYQRQFLIEMVDYLLTNMFDYLNETVENVGRALSATPVQWMPDVWESVTGIANAVILPATGWVLAVLLCLNMISLINNQNDLNSSSTMVVSVVRILVSLTIAIYVVPKTQYIIGSFFEIGSWMVLKATSVVQINASINTPIDVGSVVDSLQETSFWSVLVFLGVILFSRLMLFIVSFLVQVMILGWMVEIYIYCGIAPLPIATFWGTKDISVIGTNFIKKIAALAIQGFLMMVCMGIYSVLIYQLPSSENISGFFIKLIVTLVVLIFSMLSTLRLAKSIFAI